MSICNPCQNPPGYPRGAPGFPPPVGAGSSSSSGSSTTGGGAAVATCPEGTTLPVAAASFVVPAIGSPGQLTSLCAANWAIPGNDIVIQPFGRIRITGVNGDVISYLNLSIPAGLTIVTGSRLFQSISVEASTTTPASQLETIQGFVGGVPSTLAPAAFALLRGQLIGSNLVWNPIQAQVWYPLANPTLITDNTDPTLTNPLATGTASVTPVYTLPGLPSPLPASFTVALSIEMENPSAESTYANGFYVTGGGVEIARLHYIGGTYFAFVKATSSTFSLNFRKVSARTSCVARVYVHGYFA